MAAAKILIVDDEEDLRLPLYTAFQSEGLDTALAADGVEALEILKRGEFQVVLTDLIMPKMDGIELMEQAHALFPALVVILMSGYGTIETAVKALKGGAYDYVLKPFKLEEILHVVRRALEQQRLQKENVQLNEINRRLTEIDQIKSNLLRAISHEFRTPLTVIYGWIDLLLADQTTENALQAEGLKSIKESAMRLGRIVTNLLEFVHLGLGDIHLRREEVDLLRLVEEAMQQLSEEAKEKELGIVKDFAPNCPPLLADPEKIKILIYNLMENAIKFNQPGGKVVVEAKVTPAQNSMTLRIINTRGDIPEDRLPELMKPFTQADMSITRSASGLGLGLSVAKGIVDCHQGAFHLQSEKGKGTTVKIEFPLPKPSMKE
jgi:signal transduction histidine kinase